MKPRRVRRRRSDNLRRPRGGSGIAPSYPFTVTTLNPNVIALGSPNTSVDVNGADFQSGATVYVDGVAMTTVFVSPTLIRFTFPASVAAVPGYKTVIVKRTSFSSNTRLIAVPYPVPTVTSASLAGNVLTVGGTGIYSPGTHAYVDTTTEVPLTYLSPTSCTCVIPQSVLDVPGTHTIRLVNDAPVGGASNFFNFDTKYKNSTLVSLSVTQQYRGRASGTILLTGDTGPDSIFYPVSVVKVDGTSISFTFIDANHLSFNIPGSLLMTAGNHAITVSNPTTGGGGGTSNALQFFAFAPTFDAISISNVPQYFDGFDVTGHVDMIDSNFEATFNDVPQPTTLVDTSNFIVSILSAAIAVPGVTTIKLRDKISGATTNAKTMTVQAWDPSQIPASAGVRFWADGTSAVDDGTGRASQWSDKSPGARHVTQATAGKRPLIVASSAVLNNMPALRFDSARGDVFTTPQVWLTSGTAGVITRTAYNIWVVAQNGAGGAGNGGILGDGPGYIHVAGLSTSPERLSVLDDRGGTAVSYAAFTWSTGAKFVFRARLVPPNFYARVNRNAETSAPLFGSNAALFAPTTFVVGGKAITGSYWKGDIAFVLVANAELNYTYKALIDNMLSYQYGLPFGAAGAAPKITSINPPSCTQYDLPFWMIVEDLGGSFTPQSVVNVFDKVVTTEYLSPTQLRARIPTGALAAAGGQPISVADVGGISAPFGLTVFAYANQPGPNLYATTPNTTLQHNDAITIDCTGVGFTPTSVVYANGVACVTTPDTATHLTAIVPATALDVLPGPIITIHDGAFVSNPLEITLTPWSPASIAGISGWWVASDVLLGAGNDVAQLNDKTGNARHLTQATVANRPTLVASSPQFNGAPVLDFDGTNDSLSGSNLAALFGAGVTNCGLVFRARAVTLTGSVSQPYNGNAIIGASTGAFGYTINNPASPITYYYENDGSYHTASNPAAIGTVYCAYLNLVTTPSASLNVTLNGTPGTPGIPVTTSHGGSVPLIVGGHFSTFFNGQIPEVWTSTVTPTAQDLICWRNYSRYHYGTPG